MVQVLKEAITGLEARLAESEERCEGLARRNDVVEKGSRDRSVVIRAQQVTPASQTTP